MADHVLQFLGLCARGRNVTSGEFSVEKSIKTQHAFLVIAASDTSSNTQKNFRDMCTFYKVPFCIYGTRESLGHAIGRELRASVAVTDARMAEALLAKINAGQTTE